MSIIYFDLETTGLDPWSDDLVTFQYSNGGEVVFVDCRNGVPQDVQNMMADSNTIKVAHNAAFDSYFFRTKTGIVITNIWDTMLAERVLTLGMNESTDLASLVRKYTDIDMPPKLKGRSFKELTYGDFPDWAVSYAKKDVDVLPGIRDAQLLELEKQGLLRVAQLEFDLVPAIVGMQYSGIILDRDRWTKTHGELLRLKNEYEKKLDDLAGFETEQLFLFADEYTSTINWQSPVQILRVLHKNGIMVDGTSESVLRSFLDSHLDNALVDSLLFYKGVTGLSKFDIPKHINAHTGRVHPNFDQLKARTGRTSCSNPNLQNIPNPKMPFQRSIDIDLRWCFVPGPGNVFIAADYSQMELRVMAEQSNEQFMVEAFLNDRDLHLETARLAFEDQTIDALDIRRQYAKNANFCIIFGGGGATLAGLLGVTESEGKDILTRVHNAYPGVKRWIRTSQDQAFAQGFAATMIGRKRFFTEPSNEAEAAFLKRVAINTPVQGTAADIAKRAIIRVNAALPKCPMVLFIHDEIVIEVKEEDAQQAAHIIEREMVAAGEETMINVPTKVDVAIKQDWGLK